MNDPNEWHEDFELATEWPRGEHGAQVGLSPRRALAIAAAAFLLGLLIGRSAGGAPPIEAARLALADCFTLAAERAGHVRYISFLEPSDAEAAAVSLVLNMLAESALIQLPEQVAGGHLLRVDLDLYRINAEAWERLAAEPFWHVRVAGAEFYAPPMAAALAHLESVTGSTAPIVDARRLIAAATTTETQQGIAGLYYEFLGLDPTTTQNEFLAKMGVDAATVAAHRSDQRAALFRSRVTGKPRRIEWFTGSGVRPAAGQGLVSITRDRDDAATNAAGDPIRNLLTLDDQGREAIAEKPNGLHAFALFGGDGRLARSVPPNIAADHLIPAPHTKTLQPAIGCIRCHGPHDGWQPFANDVAKLAAGRLDVLGDASTLDSVERLAGLYGGRYGHEWRYARDTYARAVFAATRMSVEAASAAVAKIYADYVYQPITADDASRELGFDVATIEAAAVEDPIVAALLAGLSIERRQFDQIYQDLLGRGL